MAEPTFETRVRQSEVNPPKWAVDYRESELESWDTLPFRFSTVESAREKAREEGTLIEEVGYQGGGDQDTLYVLFGFSVYYPSGGFDDIVSSIWTLEGDEGAIEAARDRPDDASEQVYELVAFDPPIGKPRLLLKGFRNGYGPGAPVEWKRVDDG